jgi:hypothetical protein
MDYARLHDRYDCFGGGGGEKSEGKKLHLHF